MNISSLSINRPVLATVISILLVLFGVIGYTFLGIREFPSIDPPVVTVSTSYIGANADVIESQISEPLEESINGIAGFSINILTLLGIVLATGLVVDDAIVVLENIYHKVENGMHPIEAGHNGRQKQAEYCFYSAGRDFLRGDG
jgi:multidrug efflux pump subunit AcrB